MTLKGEQMVILRVYRWLECRNWWEELAGVDGGRKLFASGGFCRADSFHMLS